MKILITFGDKMVKEFTPSVATSPISLDKNQAMRFKDAGFSKEEFMRIRDTQSFTKDDLLKMKSGGFTLDEVKGIKSSFKPIEQKTIQPSPVQTEKQEIIQQPEIKPQINATPQQNTQVLSKQIGGEQPEYEKDTIQKLSPETLKQIDTAKKGIDFLLPMVKPARTLESFKKGVSDLGGQLETRGEKIESSLGRMEGQSSLEAIKKDIRTAMNLFSSKPELTEKEIQESKRIQEAQNYINTSEQLRNMIDQGESDMFIDVPGAGSMEITKAAEAYEKLGEDYMKSAKLQEEQGFAETSFQVGGQVLGGIGDTIGTAFMELIKGGGRVLDDATPEPVKKRLEAEWEGFKGTKEATILKEIATQGITDWNQYKIDNPRKAANLESALNFGELATEIYGAGKVGKIAGGVGESIEKGVKTGQELIEKGIKAEPTQEVLGNMAKGFEELRTAKQSKLQKKAEKLATEILQPGKVEIQRAKQAGESTSEAIKEYVKVAEEAKDFDDAIEKLMKNTEQDFDKRNARILENNYQIDQKRAVKDLEEHIAEVEKKGLASDSQIQGMKEVLEKEKTWLSTNTPDRVTAQQRKTDIYKEAQPIFKKQEARTALGNEEGRAKAFEMLGKGYKEVVEGGDDVIREINRSYGGKKQALKLLAGRKALADKAFTPTMIQKFAEPILDLVTSASTGPASFIARKALKQEVNLPKLTKKLVALSSKINAKSDPGFIENQLKGLATNLPQNKSKTIFKKLEEAKTANPEAKQKLMTEVKQEIKDIEPKPFNQAGTAESAKTIGQKAKKK